ncbi:hypothetical protein [Streptomyces sp. NPDC006997]|uniref:hypothetical protein n=1 Tax=Streptomyces sp. NPDC006997 TaxID=3155356 RepID=UPI0033FC387C
MSRTPRPDRRHAWLRALVLLLVLCVPGAHAGARAVPPVTVTAESGGTVAEADPLDTALRAPGRGAHRPAVPQRPTDPGPPRVPPAAHTPHPAAPPPPPYALRTLRCVVLIC